MNLTFKKLPLTRMMSWRRQGGRSLAEPMMTHLVYSQQAWTNDDLVHLQSGGQNRKENQLLSL